MPLRQRLDHRARGDLALARNVLDHGAGVFGHEFLQVGNVRAQHGRVLPLAKKLRQAAALAPRTGLHHVKTLELRMIEVERAGGVCRRRAGMGFAEFVGLLAPRLEGRLRAPHGVRGIERVVFRFRSLQQVEFDEALHAIEIGLAARPDLFESLFRALRDLEAVHCDENHWRLLHFATVRRSGHARLTQQFRQTATKEPHARSAAPVRLDRSGSTWSRRLGGAGVKCTGG